jgi:hypothetical protein
VFSAVAMHVFFEISSMVIFVDLVQAHVHSVFTGNTDNFEIEIAPGGDEEHCGNECYEIS